MACTCSRSAARWRAAVMCAGIASACTVIQSTAANSAAARRRSFVRALAGALAREPEREHEQVLASGEVVAQRAGRPARLGRHVADRHRLRAARGDHAPYARHLVGIADRFVLRRLGRPVPEAPRGPKGVRERAGWYRHARMWAVGVALLRAGHLVADDGAALAGAAGLWTMVLVIDFIVSFSVLGWWWTGSANVNGGWVGEPGIGRVVTLSA
jgi:hypothetical protein